MPLLYPRQQLVILVYVDHSAPSELLKAGLMHVSDVLRCIAAAILSCIS